MQTRLPACKLHNSQPRRSKCRFCASIIHICLYLQITLDWDGICFFQLNVEKCGTRLQKQGNVIDNKYFTLYGIGGFLLLPVILYLLMGWLGNKAHWHHHPSLPPLSLLSSLSPEGEVSPWGFLLAVLCQLTISMRSLMHYKLIEHRGAEDVSHWRGLVIAVFPRQWTPVPF